ncbi:aminotransferase class III-fold pyridoxal phosphate-dependent enzyme [Nocardioides carbamazepini]|uniref:aspartate aminotransferase family protein n=1 Tax=Nocardioides carbamazepini TaxID=2854259 RepID=UPI00214A5C49|nr:aminotransferase class III-fold pyridoxal phosphate-dependent enzyme [Nocardioides carbamazepini]MCR1783466.1 aminotransferase class III-fold pyridoxal phosphate-dependent enzyme [Nocardioides carbamazepini]
MTPIESWPQSAALLERARTTVGSGGLSSGLRARMQPQPLYIKHGSGAVLTDADGHDYLDYVLGWGPIILGHAHPEVTAAVTRQVRLGTGYGAAHRLEAEVAETVVDAIPGAEKVLWTNTGTEANLIALRLARSVTGRRRVAKMVGHYHGWSDPFLVGYRPDAAGDFDTAGSVGQDPGALDALDVLPFGDVDAVRGALAAREHAALFVEPVMCNSGVIPPPDGYLQELRSICTETGTTLVFDEVITGFRLAFGGAAAKYGVAPDLVVLAKALGNGLPIAAVTGAAPIVDATERGTVHAGTYNGSPLVLSGVEATLGVLHADSVYDHLEVVTSRLARGLGDALVHAGVTGHVHHVGPVLQCSLGPADASPGGFFRADQSRYDQLSAALLRRGVMVMPGGRWYVSVAHTDDQVDATVDRFADALSDLSVGA